MKRILLFAAGFLLSAGSMIAADSSEGTLIITPDDGETVGTLTTITISVANAPDADTPFWGNPSEMSAETDYVTITGPNGFTATSPIESMAGSAMSPELHATFDEIKTKGNYTAVINLRGYEYYTPAMQSRKLPESMQTATVTFTVSGDEGDNPVGPGYFDMPEDTQFGCINGNPYLTSIADPFEELSGLLNPMIPGYTTLKFPANAEVTLMKNGEIVPSESYALTDNNENFILDIQWDVFPPITAVGTYYFILPTAGLEFGGSTLEDNMKIGPFVIEKKVIEYVDAEVSYSPTGTVNTKNLPEKVVLNVENAGNLSISGVGDNIAMNRPDNSSVDFASASQSRAMAGSNSISYILPEGWYTTPGVYTVTLNSPSTTYKGVATDNKVLTFPSDPYTWSFTVEVASVDVPDLAIGGETVTGNTYEIEEGKSVTVNLSVEGADVYYKWTASAPAEVKALESTSGFVKYTAPLVIDGAGTLEYYAESDGLQSATKTMTFTMKEAGDEPALPAGIASIEPAPGTYKVWEENTEIVFTIDGMALLGTWAANDKSVTVTNPSGEEQTFAATSDGGMTKFKFNTGDFFKENGKYIVAVNVSAFDLVISMSPQEITHIAPFTIEYTLDVSTGVAGVGADGEDAEYYDLNGRRLKGELVPGIYVKNVNGKVSKVIVK